MNWLFALIVVCVVLAIVRVMAIGLAIAWMILLLCAAIRYPRETLVWLLTLGLLGLMNAQPLACIVAIGVIGVAVVIVDALRKPRARVSPRLTDEQRRR